jgi:hypothetical protein
VGEAVVAVSTGVGAIVVVGSKIGIVIVDTLVAVVVDKTPRVALAGS